MSDTQQTQPEESNTTQDPQESQDPQENSQNPWNSVAGDFQSLGKSIADAIKNTFQDDTYKEQLTELRAGLQNMTEQVASAVEETIKSSNVKSEVKKAAGEVKEVGEKVYSDTKPFLTGALKTLNEGIQSIIDRLENNEQ